MKKGLLVALLCSIGYGITLQEAVDTALQHSPVLKISQSKLSQSKKEKRESIAKSLGKISLEGGYTRYNIPRTLAPIVPPLTPGIVSSKEITSAGARYEVRLFNGFADRASIEISDLSKVLREKELKLTKEQLIYNIKALFYKILSLNEIKKSSTEYQNALRRLFEDTQKEVSAGKKAPLDLLKVESDLQEAIYQTEKTRLSIETLKSQLAALIGVEKIDKIEKNRYLEPLRTNRATDTYLYQKSLIEKRKSEKLLEKSRSVLYPTLSLNAYYGKNFANETEKELWQAGVYLKWNVFDFGYSKAKIQKAKIASIISEQALKKELLELKSRIKKGFNDLKELNAKLLSLKKRISLLQKIEKTEKIKYEKGVSDMYDLLYAMAKHSMARASLIETEYEILSQKAYLNYITAGER